jgi:hypothetical protein
MGSLRSLNKKEEITTPINLLRSNFYCGYLSNTEWLLLALGGISNNRWYDATRLGKTIFMISKCVIVNKNYYTFRKGESGPIPRESFWKDVEEKIRSKYIRKTLSLHDLPHSYYYQLTKKGLYTYNILYNKLLPKEVSKWLDELAEWMLTHTTNQIISSICKDYPEWKVI